MRPEDPLADLDELMGARTRAEKAGLTAGADMLSTVAVGRLGLAKIRVNRKHRPDVIRPYRPAPSWLSTLEPR